MRNKYQGKCYVCALIIPAQGGDMEKADGAWRVVHDRCKPKPITAAKQVLEIAGPDWKQGLCADCDKPHPAFSHDGPQGPWRCKGCHTGASPAKPVRLFPADPTQGSLL